MTVGFRLPPVGNKDVDFDFDDRSKESSFAGVVEIPHLHRLFKWFSPHSGVLSFCLKVIFLLPDRGSDLCASIIRGIPL